MYDDIADPTDSIFTPQSRQLQLLNVFAQDQVAIIPRKLELTIGTKLLYNDYTKLEWQPSIRLAFITSTKHTIWGAVSRAVRTPSRFDADFTLFRAPGNEFKSEKLTAYELGYKLHPHQPDCVFYCRLLQPV
jgi:iron complex outermembrane recepter protein